MNIFNNKELRILDIMFNKGLIYDKPYDVNEMMLSSYINIYGDLFSKSNRKLRYNNMRLARKLAGRTLIKHNIFLGCNVVDIKSGMVYLIENPSYPDHCKIGMTHDLTKRLASFQTYDPHRNFYVAHYDFTLNKREVERQLLAEFRIDSDVGEWVSKDIKFKFLDFIKDIN